MAQPSGEPSTEAHNIEPLETVVIRFAGDSGDGMQVVGTQFTQESALAGNDIATFPDFPAEIRAPAGTLAGVSGFQLNFSSSQVFTPGDKPDVLVAMNPAALKVNLPDLGSGAILIVDEDAFTTSNLRKAGYNDSPLDNNELDKFQTFSIPITTMTSRALTGKGLPKKTVVRCKNFFALGLCSWLYSRPIDETIKWIAAKFASSPALVEANTIVFKAGWNFGETAELFGTQYEVAAAPVAPGTYASITGNRALALGLMTGAAKAKLELFFASYPITPASDILHELCRHKDFGVVTFQAEDEIAAACAAIGGSFGGALGVTASSGPGIALKGEAIGLAVMTELPLVIVNVQRGGPSTGLPTKTEQADLLQALYGRNSESPVAVIAPMSPTDCFDAAIEAVHIATRFMMPVMILSDGYLANGAKPWKIPAFDEIAEFPVKFWTQTPGFHPYLRNEDTLSRPWVRLGTPGLEHRIGGIEKDYNSGDISYDPDNHERMVKVRAGKVERIADELPPTKVMGAASGDVLVLGWGSTSGAIEESVRALNNQGYKIGHVHLRWINPLPRDLGDIFKLFKKVIVPELNMGQLVRLIREHYLIDAVPVTKVKGQPFKVAELTAIIRDQVGGKS